MRIKFRAWIVSIVAPQTPVCPSLVSRQGPIPHILQHMPAEPMLQGIISSAREKAVPRPRDSARASICCAAGSALCSAWFRLLGMVVSRNFQNTQPGTGMARLFLRGNRLCKTDCSIQVLVAGRISFVNLRSRFNGCR